MVIFHSYVSLPEGKTTSYSIKTYPKLPQIIRRVTKDQVAETRNMEGEGERGEVPRDKAPWFFGAMGFHIWEWVKTYYYQF
jgi:hypothetical protein